MHGVLSECRLLGFKLYYINSELRIAHSFNDATLPTLFQGSNDVKLFHPSDLLNDLTLPSVS